MCTYCSFHADGASVVSPLFLAKAWAGCEEVDSTVF